MQVVHNSIRDHSEEGYLVVLVFIPKCSVVLKSIYQLK